MSSTQNILPLPQEEPSQPTMPPVDPAVSLIRQKVDALYQNEPSAGQEEQAIFAGGARSKYQIFIQRLMSSGKSLAEIQTAWHLYYQALTDDDKRAVWQEFYDNHQSGSKYFATVGSQGAAIKTGKVVAQAHLPHIPLSKIKSHVRQYQPALPDPPRTIADIKQQIFDNIAGKGKLTKKHHLKSLLFGVSMGLLVVFIVMFGFFNERFIAPFITPSRNVSSTPIIIEPSASDTVGPENKVIIPKINVEVPVIYDVSSIDEKKIADGLLRGVVHYPTTPAPGQDGNIAIVGHSSNNIFNKGKYKFAFVLLSRLQEGDTFMLNYSGRQYVYRVYLKKIVKPTDISVLGLADKPATATLITCDPPGTALNRMVIVGEQISPNISKNIAANPNAPTDVPAIVPGNSESLFHRIFGWLYD